MKTFRTIAAFAALGAVAAPAGASTLSVIYQADPTVDGAPTFLNPIAVAHGGVIVEPAASAASGSILLLSPAGKNKPYTRTVIHAFTDGTSSDGSNPSGHFVADKHGNVWGTTDPSAGLPNGSLFELVQPAAKGGAWTYHQVLQFPQLGASVGSSNNYGEMVFDGMGNLYGLFIDHYDCKFGCDILYKVPASVLAGGAGTATVLLNADLPYGSHNGNLARDHAGNFYHTGPGDAQYGLSPYAYGAVIQFSPPARRGDAWGVSVIHSFCSELNRQGYCIDGYQPTGAPAVDANGVLYGNTYVGGAGASTPGGVVWSLTPPAAPGGSWTFNVLTTVIDVPGLNGFGGLSYPQGDALLDKSGQVVALLGRGGRYPSASGGYIEGGVLVGGKELNNSFAVPNYRPGPLTPNTNLTQGANGNLYGGTIQYYDPSLSYPYEPGVIFKITP